MNETKKIEAPDESMRLEEAVVSVKPTEAEADTAASFFPFLSAEFVQCGKETQDMQKVAAYIRVSTDSSDQENSYETQEKYFQQLLNQNPRWISAGIYSDYGLSGTSKEKRTGFRRILRHCKEGKIDRIICKSISRFARNTADFITSLQVMNDYHVSIYFEEEALDTAEPVSRFILITLGAIAQEESHSISGNIRWGMQKRYPKGEVCNQVLYGYQYNGKKIVTDSGYQYKEIDVKEKEAEIVRRVFREVADGVSYVKIARRLNQEHILPPDSAYQRKRKENPAKGQLRKEMDEGWTARHISQMVHNERYVGDVLIQKTYTTDFLTHTIRRNKGEVEQYLVQNHHLPIVDRALYDEARKITQINAHLHGSQRTRRPCRPLSGRLICGECGRYYHVRNTKYRPIWFCPSTTLHNGTEICHAGRIYEEQIIQIFWKALSERFHLITFPQGELMKSTDTDFVVQMRKRLESAQCLDHIERDRAFQKRRIAETRQKVKVLQSKAETEELKRLQKEEERLTARLHDLEIYWEELERDYECREKAIAWMKTLPGGQQGVIQFLNGMTDEYVQAFALSITIYDSFHFTVHWFDDTRTDVKLDAEQEKWAARGR